MNLVQIYGRFSCLVQNELETECDLLHPSIQTFLSNFVENI